MKQEKTVLEHKQERSILFNLKQAVKHLAVIEECQQKLGNLCNTNMLPLLQSIQQEKHHLIKENPAYQQAWEILETIREINFVREGAS